MCKTVNQAGGEGCSQPGALSRPYFGDKPTAGRAEGRAPAPNPRRSAARPREEEGTAGFGANRAATEDGSRDSPPAPSP